MDKHTERYRRFELAVIEGFLRGYLAVAKWMVKQGFTPPPAQRPARTSRQWIVGGPSGRRFEVRTPVKHLPPVTVSSRQWIIWPPEGRRNVIDIPADGKTRVVHIDSAGRPTITKVTS